MERGNASEYTVVDASDIAGCITYWRLQGPVSLDRLAAAWEAEGLDPDKLPGQPDNETALGRAVRELHEPRRLVRPLKARGSFVVKDERVVENDTVYATVVSVSYDKELGPRFQPGDAGPAAFIAARDQIVKAYHRNQRELSTTDISTWLVGQADGVKAISLRDRGGVYFVPRDAQDFWRSATRAVAAASRQDHKVFTIPALKNEEAVAAIIDALTVQAQTEAAALERGLSAEGDDAPGARALRTKAKRCAEMLDRVAHYEGLLGQRLDDVRERIGDLQANIAAASLAVTSEAA